MSELPAGPYKILITPEGLQVPYYLIPFDKRGVCEAPMTRAALLEALADGDFTHVMLFSHGWNNDWTVATERYESFINGFIGMRQAHDLELPDPYRPLLVGIFWPSTLLVFGEDEKGPQIAGGGVDDEAVGAELASLRELAEGLPAADAARFFELTQRAELEPQEARELATLVAEHLSPPDDEVGDTEPLTADEVLSLWQASAATEPDLDDFGTVDDPAGATPDNGPEAAGLRDLIKKLDPRKLVRPFTVYQMKDRAGVVGRVGVGPLLRGILAACPARVHLLGHSFGCKVVLSATCSGNDLSRQVESMLLLQPAVSHLCFANRVPGENHPGGYRVALERVHQPILSTFTRQDVPLTKTFHLALRRARDLGDVEVAIAASEPPSRYAALGGFGPRRAGEKLIPIQQPSQVYALQDGVDLFGLRAHDEITGHGDISNASTWWALYHQLRS